MAQFFADRIALGSHRARTPEGYLIVLGVPIARTGWQTYRAAELKLPGDGDRLVHLFRGANEVFSPATMGSFEGKSITSEHPPVFLTPENDSGYCKGHAQNIRKGGTLEDGNTGLLADLVIKDAMLIQQIETGAKSEVSCGYEYDTNEYPEDDTKFFMVNISGNHIAVVRSGRAGSSVRILDSKPDDLVQKGIDVSEEKFSLTEMVQAVGIALGLSKRSATDSDPGAVERNEEQMAAAKEKRDRTMDEDKETEVKAKTEDADKKAAADQKSDEKEAPVAKEEEKKTTDSEYDKDDEKAAPPDKSKESKDKKAKDDDKDEEKKSKSEAEDDDEEEEPMPMKDKKKGKDAQDARIDKLVSAVAGLGEIVGKMVARDAAPKCTCDAEGDDPHTEKCAMFKKEGEDELIPVATLPEKDRPQNPIPGADADSTLAVLKEIAPIVAKSGNQKAIDAVNAEWKRLKGNTKGRTGDGYRELANRGEHSREKAMEDAPRQATDSEEAHAASFESITRRFLGQQPNAVKIEKEGGK